jgi:hypothetical protein
MEIWTVSSLLLANIARILGLKQLHRRVFGVLCMPDQVLMPDVLPRACCPKSPGYQLQENTPCEIGGRLNDEPAAA